MNVIGQKIGKNYAMYCGDSCEVLTAVKPNSVGLSIYSPPFVGLYIYSDSERDLGNCRTDDEFFAHYKFIIKALYDCTIPGRLTVVHCKDLPAYFHRDDYAGLKDFPGEIRKAHEECGWSFHSRITIWKCPVTERERTNNNGLLHKTLMRDRSQLRQGMADYLLVFRKVPSGTLMSDSPVFSEQGLTEYYGVKEADPRTEASFHPSKFARKKLADDNSINIWRRYAEPVWWDIDQQDVLNEEVARESKDEKHICPLQLGVIRRSVQLWSNEGDTVLSPFAGIGSEGVVSLELRRNFIGVELKPAYFKIACENLESVESSTQAELLPLA